MKDSELKKLNLYEKFDALRNKGMLIAMDESKDSYVYWFKENQKSDLDSLVKLGKKIADITVDGVLTHTKPFGNGYNVQITMRPESIAEYTELSNVYEDSLKGHKVILPKKNFRKFAKPPIKVDFRKML